MEEVLVGLTVERAKALKELYWADVVDEIDGRISKALNELRFAKPENLEKLQERIRTLEGLKGLPDNVIDSRNPEYEGV
jgi:hypothetical protein